MHYQRPDQLRKVAILVASLDEALAEELLADFPPTEALRVRELVERLGEIDPEEQRDVLDEFRHSSQLVGTVSQRVGNADSTSVAVEIDASLQRQMDRLANEETTERESTEIIAAPAVATPNDPRQDILAAAAGPTLAKLLETEHPQTIALVLSRLDERQAAETLNHLPRAKQAESIERLVHLLPAASEVVEELESQIVNSITQQRLQQEYFEAGSSQARRILALTSPAVKAGVLEQLEQSDRNVAESLTTRNDPNEASSTSNPGLNWSEPAPRWSEPEPNPLPTAMPPQAYAVGDSDDISETSRSVEPVDPSSDASFDDPLDFMDLAIRSGAVLRTGKHDQEPLPETQPAFQEEWLDKSETQEPYDPVLLEAIDASTLAALFDAVGERATQLVLAAASDALLRRILRQLPRREAKSLRQNIRHCGPTPLSELFAAQQRILQLADRSGVLPQAAA